MEESINNFLNSKDESKLFIYGNVGNGKLTEIKKIINNRFNICEINYIDFVNNNIDNKLRLINSKTNIFSLTNKKKKLIIIKEIEILKTKKLFDFFKKIIDKHIKIIMIGSGNCIKIKNDLANQSLFYEYDNKKNFNHKNINNLIGEKINFQTELKTELYKNVNKIFNNNLTINKTTQCFEIDKILNPLIIHENYKTYINKKVPQEYKHICIKETSNNINFSFILQDYILTNHYWHLQKLLSVICCYNTSYIINQKYSGLANVSNIKLNYTALMTKKSNIYINRKKHHENFMKIKNYHTFDSTLMEYLYKNIALMLLSKEHSQDTYRFMENINFDKKNIHTILKFTKNFNFIEDTSKYKKIIMNNLK